MNCFPCCAPKKSLSQREDCSSPPPEPVTAAKPAPEMKKPEPAQVDPANINVHNFTFRELATATKNFRQECLMAEGGFGRIYRGVIPATGQLVAVKQLDRNGMQSSKEFLSEVAELSALHHENLVNLIGYCADGDQRLLVYELFSGRTLENRLFEKEAGESPLNWYDRMKIVAAASKGLEYLHDSANPPVLFRDLKSSNILVDTNLQARLCDFGMTKLTGGDKMSNAPPRLMGTYGYCAPEYVRSGQLTMKSDVYSFGVVLLELITGRRVVDTTKPNEEQNLVSWAQPLFRDPKRYPDMADPALNKNFPEKDLNQVVAIASMCLQEEAEARPLMSDVVTALSFLSAPPPTPIPIPTAVSKKSSASGSRRGSEYGSESESECGSRRSSVDGGLLGSFKPSRKSSSRSKKHNSESGDGSVSSSSSKSSRKSSSKKSTEEDGTKKKSKKVISEEEVIKKMAKKKISEEDVMKKMKKKKSSEGKELKEKSSRKSSIKSLTHKISKKSSSKTSSHKSSSVSSSRRSSNVSFDDGETYSQRSSMILSPGGISFGIASSADAHSEHNSSRRSEDESIHYEGRSSAGSDAESVHSEE